MNTLIRFMRDVDPYTGELSDKESEYYDKWHLVAPFMESACLFAVCSHQVYGESNDAVKYELKYAERGGVTCPSCMEKIKQYKSIKL